MNRSTLTAVALVATMLLAGCTGTGPGTPTGPTPTDADEVAPTDGPDGTAEDTDSVSADGEPMGTLAFYVSDRPNAIEDFQHLNVTIDSVVLFRSGDVEAGTASPTPTATAQTVTPTATATSRTANATSNATESTGSATPTSMTSTGSATPTSMTSTGSATSTQTTPERTETEVDGGDGEDAAETDGDGAREGDGEKVVLDVPGRTVDLTRLRGNNATLLGTFGIPTGRYTTVHLEVSDVNATLTTGEPVNVKLPSEKLHVAKPFAVTANESVDFVFDIAVHQAGKSGKYILHPVISESGTDVSIDPVGGARGPPADRGRDADDSDEGSERDLSMSVVGTVTPGANVTVVVTRNGTAVPNATVAVNDEVVGETGDDGRLTFVVPADAEALHVEVEHGEAEAERAFEFEETRGKGSGKGRDGTGRGNG